MVSRSPTDPSTGSLDLPRARLADRSLAAAVLVLRNLYRRRAGSRWASSSKLGRPVGFHCSSVEDDPGAPIRAFHTGQIPETEVIQLAASTRRRTVSVGFALIQQFVALDIPSVRVLVARAWSPNSPARRARIRRGTLACRVRLIRSSAFFQSLQRVVEALQGPCCLIPESREVSCRITGSARSCRVRSVHPCDAMPCPHGVNSRPVR